MYLRYELYLKLMIKIALLLTILLVTQSVTVTNPLTIFYVSTSATSISKTLKLSHAGGTMLYIKVTGHSLDATDNHIFVDIYPCIIPSDGVSDTFISCETTSSGQTVDSGNLEITLISGSQSKTISSPYTPSYSLGVTPTLVQVYPTAGIAGTSVNLWGIHRITDLGDGQKVLGDVVKLKLGFDICSTFFISQGPILNNSLDTINCKQSPIQ
jgi:hypothetical protein